MSEMGGVEVDVENQRSSGAMEAICRLPFVQVSKKGIGVVQDEVKLTWSASRQRDVVRVTCPSILLHIAMFGKSSGKVDTRRQDDQSGLGVKVLYDLVQAQL